MFEARFEHYLSYGATDQQTVRDLADSFTGLLVPGTVAAFQREGTGGFVLALSASQAGTPYAIDPRFPLFQQALPAPKKSHSALAEIMGVPQLVLPHRPQPSMFTKSLIETVAKKWAAFNESYQEAAGAKFDKYAERLGEPVEPSGASGPKYVLAPYTIAQDTSDPWWMIAIDLFERTRSHLDHPDSCVRVIATDDVGALGSLLTDTDVDRVAVWVSNLDELRTPAPELSSYAEAIRDSSDKRMFALYGGFFSVLLSCVGLRGSSHGIGFGEYRDYLELPRSGPPPSRYYLPRVHRYVSQEHAYQLWVQDSSLAECQCNICAGEPPIGLDYHSLMEHSVLCRTNEIEEWVGLNLEDCVKRLADERRQFLSQLNRSRASDLVKAEGMRNAAHLREWIDALESL